MRQAQTGFYDRTSRDVALAALIGTKASGRANVYPGYGSRPASAEDGHRVTYFRPADAPVRPGIMRVRLQVDLWVWPETEGGEERVADVDARLIELLDEKTWSFDGKRLSCVALTGRDVPNGIGRPLRRTRDFQITVSPA